MNRRDMISMRIGIEDDIKKNKIKREAVRAVVLKKNKLLLLESKYGDVKLPGGGVESDENLQEAIKREILEETGHECIDIVSFIGSVIERKVDSFDENGIFEMESLYYICLVEDIPGEIKLTESEKNVGLKPIWLPINDAIIKNINAYSNDDRTEWLNRESIVLQQLLNNQECIVEYTESSRKEHLINTYI